MKRIMSILLACMLIMLVAYANAEIEPFIDAETGISFVIPESWNEIPNTENSTYLKVQYSPSNKMGEILVMFNTLDIYTLTNMSQQGVSRKDIDFRFLTDDFITRMMGPQQILSNEIKQYGNYQYKVITNKLAATNNGMNYSFDVETVSTIINGYFIWFQYIAMNDYDLYHPIFESILESIQID